MLKHFSHTNYSISIWIKEATTVMMEDSKAFIFNLTEVSLSTYSVLNSAAGYATLTSTESAIESLSKKAAFHIIKNLDLNVTDAISKGDFSSTELESIGRENDAIQI